MLIAAVEQQTGTLLWHTVIEYNPLLWDDGEERIKRPDDFPFVRSFARSDPFSHRHVHAHALQFFSIRRALCFFCRKWFFGARRRSHLHLKQFDASRKRNQRVRK